MQVSFYCNSNLAWSDRFLNQAARAWFVAGNCFGSRSGMCVYVRVCVSAIEGIITQWRDI